MFAKRAHEGVAVFLAYLTVLVAVSLLKAHPRSPYVMI
jgi:hypothetical protein